MAHRSKSIAEVQAIVDVDNAWLDAMQHEHLLSQINDKIESHFVQTKKA